MKKEKWISVSDQLPEENILVKATLLNFYTQDKIETHIFINNFNWFINDREKIPFDYDVLCWLKS